MYCCYYGYYVYEDTGLKQDCCFVANGGWDGTWAVGSSLATDNGKNDTYKEKHFKPKRSNSCNPNVGHQASSQCMKRQ